MNIFSRTQSIVGLAVIVFVVVILGIWFRSSLQQVVNELSPTPSSPGPSPNKSVQPSAAAFLGPTGLKQPGSCALNGEIIFRQPNLFESQNVHISWRNIDSQSRLILWEIVPQDTLAVGPNLLGNLSIPNGSSSLTVGLPPFPKAREYRLTASVTYGQLVDGNVVVKEARCGGSTAVKLAF